MIRKISHFSKIVFSYLVILVFVLVIMVLTNIFIIRAIDNNIIQLKIESLERKEAAISSMLKEIDEYTYQYSRDSRITEMIDSDARGNIQVGMFLGINRSIPQFSSFNTATRNYVLSSLTFLKNSGTIITDTFTYMTQHWTRDYLIHGYDVDEWRAVIETTGRVKLFSLEPKSALIDTSLLYRTNLPYGSDGSSNAVLLLCLNRKKIEEQLLAGYDSRLAAAYVIDQSGQIILTNGVAPDAKLPALAGRANTFAYDLDGTRMTVFHISSIYNGWSYVWMLPSDLVYSERNFIVMVIMLILGSVFVFGIGLIIAMARRQNRPVTEIVKLMRPDTRANPASLKQFDDLDWIKGNIQDMMLYEQNLKKQLMSNKDLVRFAMLEKLLEGRFPDELAAEKALRQIQFPFSMTGYAVLVLQIVETEQKSSSVSNTQIQHSVLLNFITGKYPDVVTHSVNYQRIVLIYHADPAGIKPGQIDADQLRLFLADKGHTNVRIGAGNTCHGLTEICRSYLRACFSLARTNGADGEQTVEHKSEQTGALYYPLDIEQKIISMVSMGDATETQAALQHVYQQNIDSLTQQEELIHVFLSELVGTLVKAIDAAGLADSQESETAASLLQNQLLTPDKAFQAIQDAYLRVCLQIRQNYRDSTSILIKNIQEYIETFYMDPSLSLGKLAGRFGLSEPYLSHIFKERTGENLSNCLERIRINNAHALLSETNMSIDDIALKVGYYSADTFRKAFKRYHGISPAMYRSSTRSA